MIYSIKDGKLIPAEKPDNHRYNNLPAGTVIKYSGDMANSSAEFVIIERRQITPEAKQFYHCIAREDYRDHNIEPFLFDGNRFVVTDEVADKAEILELWSMNKIKKAHEEEAKELEKKRKADLRDKYIRENPKLETGISYITASKNIRRELKKSFPGIKFYVNSSGYSGGNSIDIKWTDGPTIKQVQGLTTKYEYGSFDGMTDSYNYDRRNFWVEIFGGTKYLNTSRSYSDDHIKKALENFGECDGKIYTVEDYKQGRIFTQNQSHSHWVNEEMEKF